MNKTENNRTTVRAYVEAFNCGEFDRIRTLFAQDARIHGVIGSATLETAVAFWKQLHDGLNCRLEVIDLCAEGDVVVARYKETGRWTGSFLDFNKPTGNSFELLAMEWFVLRNGLIAERWGVRDAAAQARQLGFPMSVGSGAKAA